MGDLAMGGLAADGSDSECLADAIEPFAVLLTEQLTTPMNLVLLLAVLLGVCLLVAVESGKSFIYLFAPVVYLSAGLLAAAPSVSIQRLPYACGIRLVALTLGATLAAFAILHRVVAYAGLGFGAGAMLAWTIISTVASDVVDVSAQQQVAIVGVTGFLGALWLPRFRPRSVKDRAIANEPNYTQTIDLPFTMSDIFYEMLDPRTPLGAANGEYSSSETKTAEWPNGAGTRKKEVIKTGAERTAVLQAGTTKSKLLHTSEPPSTPAVIIWQQLETNLVGVNMRGSGKGDEPGVKIQISSTTAGKTQVAFQYFFTELSGSSGLSFFPPKWEGIDGPVLQKRITEQMTERGYQPTREDGAAAGEVGAAAGGAPVAAATTSEATTSNAPVTTSTAPPAAAPAAPKPYDPYNPYIQPQFETSTTKERRPSRWMRPFGGRTPPKAPNMV